jgi:hypothetical protein
MYRSLAEPRLNAPRHRVPTALFHNQSAASIPVQIKAFESALAARPSMVSDLDYRRSTGADRTRATAALISP